MWGPKSSSTMVQTQVFSTRPSIRLTFDGPDASRAARFISAFGQDEKEP